MGRLTESAAERLIAARAFAAGPPGFVGAAIDLPGSALAPIRAARPALDPTGADRPALDPTGAERWALRHGFVVARADGVVTVSGPPSPGLESCLARMGDDLGALPGVRPGGGAAAGIRVGLEAGLDGAGPLGLPRRWRLAHTLAPVLAAAFANSPSAGGWRSSRAARFRDRPVLPGLSGAAQDPTTTAAAGTTTAATNSERAGRTAAETSGHTTSERGGRTTARAGGLNPCAAELGGIDPCWARDDEPDTCGRRPGADPRSDWAAHVMDAPSAGRSLRERLRSDDPVTEPDLWRHIDDLPAPVTARGHLELDVVDGQEGDGWRVAVAVVSTLLDDPIAATAAETATASLAYAESPWLRAARDALTDPELAAAARDCFVAAYAALARRGAPRDLRDAVAAYTDRYVMRGRCPADDRIAAPRPRPIEAG